MKLQQSSDDGAADAYSDIEGSSVSVADDDDNQIVVHDIYRPQKRYLKVVVGRGTANAVIDGIVASLYGARKQPTTDDSATVVSLQAAGQPDEALPKLFPSAWPVAMGSPSGGVRTCVGRRSGRLQL